MAGSPCVGPDGPAQDRDTVPEGPGFRLSYPLNLERSQFFSKTSQIDIPLRSSLTDSMKNQTMGGPSGHELRGPRNGPGPSYLTVAEVAELLGVATSFVYRRTSAGHPDPIPCYRFGGHLRFLWSEVQGWASEHRKEPAEIPLPPLVAAGRQRSSHASVTRRSR